MDETPSSQQMTQNRCSQQAVEATRLTSSSQPACSCTPPLTTGLWGFKAWNFGLVVRGEVEVRGILVLPEPSKFQLNGFDPQNGVISHVYG